MLDLINLGVSITKIDWVFNTFLSKTGFLRVLQGNLIDSKKKCLKKDLFLQKLNLK